jgi:hypothetical protein
MKDPKRIELSAPQADELLQRLQKGALNDEDYELLGSMVRSWLWLFARRA